MLRKVDSSIHLLIAADVGDGQRIDGEEGKVQDDLVDSNFGFRLLAAKNHSNEFMSPLSSSIVIVVKAYPTN